jgi:hypothetical protein
MTRELLDGERIFVIHDFLTSDECQALIAGSEALGYETFTVEGEVVPGYRNNARLMVDDPALADRLWSRAARHLPPEIEGQPAGGLNPRFRYYRYTGAEAFAPHYDGSIRVGDRVSKLTFMVYLTDVSAGGETRFYGDGMQIRFAIRPERGKALIFDHLILHEGATVQAGTKYVLRTDVMYG